MTDYNLGNFIVNLHRKKQDHLTNAKYDHKTIKNYIMIGKKIKPKITHEAAELMKKFYIELRNKDKSYNSYRITVRQL
jgi:DNA replicative helicase MCM subunit Mcm2 (Cdc46/Mcm family)